MLCVAVCTGPAPGTIIAAAAEVKLSYSIVFLLWLEHLIGFVLGTVWNLCSSLPLILAIFMLFELFESSK